MDRLRVLATSRGVSLDGAIPIEEVTGAIDILVIAGGPGAEGAVHDKAYLHWIAESAGRSRCVASICTGAFALAAAGILDGKRAGTHWRFCDRLAREFPKVNVNPDAIYLRDGSIYITAGIDLTLALVEEDHGHKTALIDNCSRYCRLPATMGLFRTVSCGADSGYSGKCEDPKESGPGVT